MSALMSPQMSLKMQTHMSAGMSPQMSWNRNVILYIYDFGRPDGMGNVVFADWELKGKGAARLIDEMWFHKIVTKTLINIRYRLNWLID